MTMHLTEVPVPATRSVSYLRGSLADLHPHQVAVFDEELRKVSAAPFPTNIDNLRRFLFKWTVYIALFGTPAHAAFALQLDPRHPETAHQLTTVLRLINRNHFPDARPDFSNISIRTRTTPTGYEAVCPITMLRRTASTESAARALLDAALAELLHGY